ncbi:MAG: HEAT repeat domain-containing protein, partial [Candidatus Saelkia tenebricola]|nr:HEAT repeat domain-containing protein [Candidatus Saelkia tenebricola]
IAALSDSDSDVREEAASALGDIGDIMAVEPLIAALSDRDSDVREEAASALGDIGDIRAVEPLIKSLLEDKNTEVRLSAAGSLGEIGGSRAIESLILVLGDDKLCLPIYCRGGMGIRDDRIQVVEVLVKLGGGAIDPLCKALLENECLDIRRYTASALGKIGDARAVEPLIAALSDSDSDVRGIIPWALKDIGAAAVDACIAHINDSNWWVREGVIEALGYIGDERATSYLTEALNDSHPEVRQRAKESLAMLGGAVEIEEVVQEEPQIPTIEELSVQLASENKDEVLSAISVVKEYSITDAVDALLSLLGSSDSDIRLSSADALAELESSIEDDKLAVLVDNAVTLIDNNAAQESKINAIGQLGQLGDLRAVDVLARTLADNNTNIKFASMSVLVNMGNNVSEILQGYVEDPNIGNDIKYLLDQISYSDDSQTEYADFTLPEGEDFYAVSISEPLCFEDFSFN